MLEEQVLCRRVEALLAYEVKELSGRSLKHV